MDLLKNLDNMITVKNLLKTIYNEGSGAGGDSYNEGDIERIMIEFAKLHTEAALKAASEKAKLSKAYNYGNYDESTAIFKPIETKCFIKIEYGHGDCGYEAVKINEDSILNAYPLELIK